MSSELVNVATGEIIEHEAPAAFLSRAREMAVMLDDVVRKQRLDVDIQGKRYLKVEAWQFLAGMAQLTPRTREIETLRDDSGKPVGVRVYVELVRDADSAVIGGAYGRCDYGERIGKSGAYAAESMAQTRATSKAISQKLRFVPVLAGYQGTPIEEMTGVEPRPARQPRGEKWARKSDEELGDQSDAPTFDHPPSEGTRKVRVAENQGGDSVSPPPSEGQPSYWNEPLPKLVKRPQWAGKTWGWLSEGRVGGDRHAWINGVLDNPDAPKHLKLRCEYLLMVIEDRAKA